MKSITVHICTKGDKGDCSSYEGTSLLQTTSCLITPLSRVRLEKLTGFSYSRNYQHFMEPEGSLTHSQEPVTCAYPEPARSFHAPTSQVLKILLNIILPSTPGPSKCPLSLRFPHLNPVYASPLTHARYMLRPSHSSRFYHPNNTG